MAKPEYFEINEKRYCRTPAEQLLSNIDKRLAELNELLVEADAPAPKTMRKTK